MKKFLLIILAASIVLAIIIFPGRIPLKNLRLNQKNGIIVEIKRGALKYNLSDIFRRQFRISISAKGVTLKRGQEPAKGFLASFLLPEPESQINFEDAVISVNFHKRAAALENLQLIGKDIVVTGSGISVGKKSMNYTLVFYPSQETTRKILAQFGNPTDNLSANNKIILKMYGEPKYPFVNVLTDKFRMSFKVGTRTN